MGILYIKLNQLDERMGKLHSSIHISQKAGHSQLRREMETLQKECEETQAALRENLQQSKSSMVSVLAQGYGQVEQIVQQSRKRLQDMAQDSPDAEAVVEEKILLAEYALDFAQQAADRALLLSMDAMDAQLLQQEGRSV